jgi:hypothetical protein
MIGNKKYIVEQFELKRFLISSRLLSGLIRNDNLCVGRSKFFAQSANNFDSSYNNACHSERSEESFSNFTTILNNPTCSTKQPINKSVKQLNPN